MTEEGVIVARDLQRGCDVEIRAASIESASDSDKSQMHERLARAAVLRHAYLVPLEAWSSADNWLWTISPRRAGVSLRTWLDREGQLPFLETVMVLTQLAQVLNHAHREGIYWGTVSSSTMDWCEHQVRWSGLVEPGRAQAEPATDASDHVLQFGALSYEILTGRAPATSGKLEPVNRLRLHMPPGLARIVMRCLHGDPQSRWPSMEPILALLVGMVTPPPGYRAPQLVNQGRFLLRRRGASIAQALERFDSAAKLDPRCAGAFAGVAEAAALLRVFGEPEASALTVRARTAAARAREIEPRSCEAHVALGLLSLAEDFDASAALAHFERAVEQDPRNAEARAWFAWTIAASEGSSARALTQAREGVRSDPSSAHAADVLARIAFAAGDHDSGLAGARHAVDLDPAWPRLRSFGLALAATSHRDEAVEVLERARQSSNGHPHVLGALGCVLAARGELAGARAAWDELLIRRSSPAGEANVQSTVLAQLAAWLGDDAGVQTWIDRAREDRDAAWWFLHLRDSPADWPAR
jgi:tetratricopeptide (TPR) repeat protein